MSENIFNEDNFYSCLDKLKDDEIINLYKELDVYLDAFHLLAPVMRDLFEDMKTQIYYFVGYRYISETMKKIEAEELDE